MRVATCDRVPTIGIVDDDLSVCRALSRMVKVSGFEVRSYGSAQELLGDEQLGGIDLLLLDIKMPAVDGFALQRQLAVSGLSIPFVFMTSYDNDAWRAKAIEEGAIAFMLKPLDETDLLAAIHKGLGLMNS